MRKKKEKIERSKDEGSKKNMKEKIMKVGKKLQRKVGNTEEEQQHEGKKYVKREIIQRAKMQDGETLRR